MARGKRLDPALIELIREKLAQELSPKQMLEDRSLEDVDLRTIQRYVRRFRSPSAGGTDEERWNWHSASGEEIARLLPVLAEVIQRTQGRRHYLTAVETSWVSKIHQAAPDIAPWWAYRLAQEYIARLRPTAGRAPEPTDDLDWLLLFAPWRSDAAKERWDKTAVFIEAVWRAWVRKPYTVIRLAHVMRNEAREDEEDQVLNREKVEGKVGVEVEKEGRDGNGG